MIKVATVCTGIGAPEQAIKELEIEHEIVFGCEIDKYARTTYQANFSPHTMYEDMTIESWEGDHYYSDLFVGGIPCQAFSLAGKQLGELDPRGLLFYNFYDYVKKQRPKSFIIENVKGLLSDDSGNTFKNWLQLLGNSVNLQNVMFPHPDSLGYNLHWTVLNSKDFGVPQNRERVFLVGIREDLPNTFRFPAGWPLDIRLKDVLEDDVDEKYFLSDKMVAGLIQHNENSKEKGRGFNFEPIKRDGIAKCIRANNFKMGPDDNYVFDTLLSDSGLSRKRVKRDIALPLRSHDGCGSGQGAKTGLYAVNGAKSKRISGWYENENTIGAYMDDSKRSSVQEHIYHKPTGICNTIQTAHVPKIVSKRIRRLTPRECFRLQGFPDTYDISKVSDTQAYKQAGNSITVSVMKSIIKNLVPILEMKEVEVC